MKNKYTITNANKTKSKISNNSYFPRDFLNKLIDNHTVVEPLSKNFKTNIEIPSPTPSARNSFNSNKIKFSKQKSNKYNTKDIINLSIKNKLSKQNNIINKNLKISIKNKYSDKNKRKRLLQMNNKVLTENLKIKNCKKKEKNCTNLLISNTETQYPISTYYFSPINYTTSFSVFNNIIPNFKKNEYNDMNKSHEFNISNYFLPLERNTVGYRSESENNIFISKFPEFNNINYFKTSNNYYNNNNKQKLLNSLFKNRLSCNYNTFNDDLKNEYYINNTITNSKIKKNKYTSGRFSMKEKNRKLHNLIDFIIYLKRLFIKITIQLKRLFFRKLKMENNSQSLNYINNNKINNSISLKHAQTSKIFNKNKTYILPKSIKILQNNSNINKNNKKVYIPKKSININTSLSKKYCSININNPKHVTLKIQNNYQETNYSNTNTNSSNFKEYLTVEKINNTETHINPKKKVFSLDFNTNSLYGRFFSEKSLIDNHNHKNKHESNSPTLNRIYQKKLGKNVTSKKYLYKSGLLSKMVNNTNINKSKYDKNNNKKNAEFGDKIKNKNIFNFNNGMLIERTVSDDDKLYININYVILINKRKNNKDIKKTSSFITSDFKVKKNDDFYIIKNVLNEANMGNKIKKDEAYYKKKKKLFFNYLKMNKFYPILKKHIYRLIYKKLLKHNLNIMKKNKHTNNQINIEDYDSSKNSINNKNFIRVKKVNILKKLTVIQKMKINLNGEKKLKTLDKMTLDFLKDKIINISNKFNLKNTKIFFNRWKNLLNKKRNKIIHINNNNQMNIYLRYKEKLTSVINKKIFTLRILLIIFTLSNKNKNIKSINKINE